MEMDIVQGKLGSFGDYDLEFKNGKLVLALKAGIVGFAAGLTLEVGADAVIDAVEKAIPGTIDNAILEVLWAALK